MGSGISVIWYGDDGWLWTATIYYHISEKEGTGQHSDQRFGYGKRETLEQAARVAQVDGLGYCGGLR